MPGVEDDPAFMAAADQLLLEEAQSSESQQPRARRRSGVSTSSRRSSATLPRASASGGTIHPSVPSPGPSTQGGAAVSATPIDWSAESSVASSPHRTNMEDAHNFVVSWENTVDGGERKRLAAAVSKPDREAVLELLPSEIRAEVQAAHAASPVAATSGGDSSGGNGDSSNAPPFNPDSPEGWSVRTHEGRIKVFQATGTSQLYVVKYDKSGTSLGSYPCTSVQLEAAGGHAVKLYKKVSEGSGLLGRIISH